MIELNRRFIVGSIIVICLVGLVGGGLIMSGMVSFEGGDKGTDSPAKEYFKGTIFESEDIFAIVDANGSEPYTIEAMSQYGNPYFSQPVLFAGFLNSISPELAVMLTNQGIPAAQVARFKTIVLSTVMGESFAITQDQSQLLVFESTAAKRVAARENAELDSASVSVYTHGGSADPVYKRNIVGEYMARENAICFEGTSAEGTHLIVICSSQHYSAVVSDN